MSLQATRERKARPQYRTNATVRHTNGTGLFVLTVPNDWRVAATRLQHTGSSSRPYMASAELCCGPDARMTLETGEAGMRLSKGMEALMATYGQALAGVDRANYAPMPDPRAIADTRMRVLQQQLLGTELYRVRDVRSRDLPALREKALRLFTKKAEAEGGARLRDPFAAEVLRIYELKVGDQPHNAAVYVRLLATKDGSGIENMNPLGAMFGLGPALGGLFSRGGGARSAPPRSAPPRAQTASAMDWCIPDFTSYVGEGTIFWDVTGVATLVARADSFEGLLNNALMPLARSYTVHDDLWNLSLVDVQQQAAAVQQVTNREIQASNMRTQASLAAARQAQAAADARFEAWQQQSDAHHAAFRARSNAQFNTGAGTSAPDYSEAIRGVNTYRTSDGREVELDVSAERAYENQAGDVVGGSGGFDPGADWTEIPRA